MSSDIRKKSNSTFNIEEESLEIDFAEEDLFHKTNKTNNTVKHVEMLQRKIECL